MPGISPLTSSVYSLESVTQIATAYFHIIAVIAEGDIIVAIVRTGRRLQHQSLVTSLSHDEDADKAIAPPLRPPIRGP